MKVNKVLLLIALPFIAQLTMAVCCCDDDDNRIIQGPSLLLNNMDYYFVDNSGLEPQLLFTDSTILDTVNRNAFGMNLRRGGYYMASNTCKSKGYNFLPSAFACSCGDYSVSEVTYLPIDSFSVKSMQSYNPNFPKGSELNSMLRILNGDAFSIIPTSQWALTSNVNLLFMEPADSAGLYQFEVSYRVNDTLKITDTTKLVYLF